MLDAELVRSDVVAKVVKTVSAKANETAPVMKYLLYVEKIYKISDLPMGFYKLVNPDYSPPNYGDIVRIATQKDGYWKTVNATMLYYMALLNAVTEKKRALAYFLTAATLKEAGLFDCRFPAYAYYSYPEPPTEGEELCGIKVPEWEDVVKIVREEVLV